METPSKERLKKEKEKAKKQTFTKKDIDDNKLMAVLAYIIFFVPLLTEGKDSPFVKYHVKQGIMLVLFGLAVFIFGTVLPIIGWLIILPFGSLTFVVFWLIGILNVINGEAKELPLIGKFAQEWFKF